MASKPKYPHLTDGVSEGLRDKGHHNTGGPLTSHTCHLSMQMFLASLGFSVLICQMGS